MKLALILIGIVCFSANNVYAQEPASNIQLFLDLKPEEVQQLLANQNTNLKFAPYLGTVPVARTSPEEPEKIEDIYDVSQFHGQDGLGSYLYGYSNPADTKVEGKNGNNVRGAYNWVQPNGQVIKVKYWDTGNGFHHEDNLPKVALKPVEETPALREARLAHEKAWKEAAEANKVSPSQYRLVYNDQNSPNNPPSLINHYPNYDVAASAAESVYVKPEGEDDGAWNPELYGEGGTTSEPRGFFYSFNHPAGVKYNKDEYELKRLSPHDDVASLDGPLEP